VAEDCSKNRVERVRLVGLPPSKPSSRQQGHNAQRIKLAGPLEHLPIEQLKLPPRALKNHPQEQIDLIKQSYKTFGFVSPIVADDNDIVRAGVARLIAAKVSGLTHVPVVRLKNLSEAKLRAFQAADNKLAERSRWNRKLLALELPELRDLLVVEGLDIAITGFEPAEIDQLTLDFEKDSSEPADDYDEKYLSDIAVSRLGDTWKLGSHRLHCADSRDSETLSELMGARRADMAFLDPPYNVKVKDVVGRGRTKHDEFAMASGEMSPQEFTNFLGDTLGAAADVSRDGAVHYVCMDWRHLGELFAAGKEVYGAFLNLAVWVKSNAGQGSFYRSQHEHIGVFRVGKARHLNNVQLGRHGRSRSNVWQYQGANTFRPGRMDDLRAHPTVKPVALVCDAIRDSTRRGDTVLDTFCGSGTTLLACERVGRRGIGVEIEPRFVDLAIRRWQEFSGRDAIHVKTGRRFNEVAARRAQRKLEAAA
jgi:DNA modification methylase